MTYVQSMFYFVAAIRTYVQLVDSSDINVWKIQLYFYINLRGSRLRKPLDQRGS